LQQNCFQSNANFLNLVLRGAFKNIWAERKGGENNTARKKKKQRTKDERTTKMEAQNRRTKTKRDRQEANARIKQRTQI